VLLTALAAAFAGWTGQRTLLVDLEGHGREALFADVDVSRTVGWFTSLFPVLLDAGTATDPGHALKAVKEELRAVPTRGIGYGLLRYLGGDDAAALPAPEPEISFNYLGQLDGGSGDVPFRFATEDVGALQDASNARAHLIDISAHVRDGRLQMQWAYSTAIHQTSTVEAVAASFVAHLQNLIEHCEASEGGFTPSDFPLLQGNLTGADQ
jgi:non-ribosomal peptide synthase protein (TIGR01720 family)